MKMKVAPRHETVSSHPSTDYTEAELAWLRAIVMATRDIDFRAAQFRRKLLRQQLSFPTFLLSQEIIEIITDFAPPAGTKEPMSKSDLHLLLLEISKAERGATFYASKDDLIQKDRGILAKVHLQIGLIVLGFFVACLLFLRYQFWKYETFGYWTFDNTESTWEAYCVWLCFPTK
jgi:hypothetical protein